MLNVFTRTVPSGNRHPGGPPGDFSFALFFLFERRRAGLVSLLGGPANVGDGARRALPGRPGG